MFIQKVFYVHQPLAETRRQLARLPAFRARVPGLNKVVLTADGVAQFECAVGGKMKLHAVLVELPTEEENQTLFHSTVGNVRVAGLVALKAIRPGVTEVHLAVEYTLRSLVAWCANLGGGRVERYVDDALRALQVCLDGRLAGASAGEEALFSEPQLQWNS